MIIYANITHKDFVMWKFGLVRKTKNKNVSNFNIVDKTVKELG